MPLALVGLAATAVGAGLQIAGNEKSKSAMNKARANEVAQQTALQRKNTALFQSNASKQGSANASQEMQAGADARTNIWNQLQKASSPIASALPATGTNSAKKRTDTASNSWNSIVAGNKAKLASTGDWQNQRAINNADTSQKIGVNNDFSRADANLLPLELQVANSKGDALRGWGSIVSSIGSIAGGLSGIGGAAGATNGASSLAGIGSASTGIAGTLAGGGTPIASAGGIPSGWTNVYN